MDTIQKKLIDFVQYANHNNKKNNKINEKLNEDKNDIIEHYNRNKFDANIKNKNKTKSQPVTHTTTPSSITSFTLVNKIFPKYKSCEKVCRSIGFIFISKLNFLIIFLC